MVLLPSQAEVQVLQNQLLFPFFVIKSLISRQRLYEVLHKIHLTSYQWTQGYSWNTIQYMEFNIGISQVSVFQLILPWVESYLYLQPILWGLFVFVFTSVVKVIEKLIVSWKWNCVVLKWNEIEMCFVFVFCLSCLFYALLCSSVIACSLLYTFTYPYIAVENTLAILKLGGAGRQTKNTIPNNCISNSKSLVRFFSWLDPTRLDE